METSPDRRGCVRARHRRAGSAAGNVRARASHDMSGRTVSRTAAFILFPRAVRASFKYPYRYRSFRLRLGAVTRRSGPKDIGSLGAESLPYPTDPPSSDRLSRGASGVAPSRAYALVSTRGWRTSSGVHHPIAELFRRAEAHPSRLAPSHLRADLRNGLPISQALSSS